MKKKGSNIILYILIFVVIFIIGLFAWQAGQDDKKNDNKNKDRMELSVTYESFTVKKV